MYGAVWCFVGDSFEGGLMSYYGGAKNKPQVLSDAFDKAYFMSLINDEGVQKKSAKAFLGHGSDDSRFGKWRVARYSVSGSGTSEDEDCGSFAGEKGRAFRVCEEGFAGDIPTGRTLFREGFV